jgi:hypothetical protein
VYSAFVKILISSILFSSALGFSASNEDCVECSSILKMELDPSGSSSFLIPIRSAGDLERAYKFVSNKIGAAKSISIIIAKSDFDKPNTLIPGNEAARAELLNILGLDQISRKTKSTIDLTGKLDDQYIKLANFFAGDIENRTIFQANLKPQDNLVAVTSNKNEPGPFSLVGDGNLFSKFWKNVPNKTNFNLSLTIGVVSGSITTASLVFSDTPPAAAWATGTAVGGIMAGWQGWNELYYRWIGDRGILKIHNESAQKYKNSLVLLKRGLASIVYLSLYQSVIYAAGIVDPSISDISKILIAGAKGTLFGHPFGRALANLESKIGPAIPKVLAKVVNVNSLAFAVTISAQMAWTMELLNMPTQAKVVYGAVFVTGTAMWAWSSVSLDQFKNHYKKLKIKIGQCALLFQGLF